MERSRYLWDYGEPSVVHTVPGDSTIISVALCPASDALASQPDMLLVMATRLSVSLVGLAMKPSFQVLPLQGCSAASQGALFHSMKSTAGRIFLLSGAPYLWELRCESSWLRPKKCRLVRHQLDRLGADIESWRRRIKMENHEILPAYDYHQHVSFLCIVIM